MSNCIVVANSNEPEAYVIASAVRRRYAAVQVAPADICTAVTDETLALVLDANCSEHHAIDTLMEDRKTHV